jgi:hypothetical protein
MNRLPRVRAPLLCRRDDMYREDYLGLLRRTHQLEEEKRGANEG